MQSYDPFDDQIIRLAYTAAADPLMFESFIAVLEDSGQATLETAAPDDDVDGLSDVHARMDRLKWHLDQALALSDAQAPRRKAPNLPGGGSDDPVVLLDGDGRIETANSCARTMLDLEVGQRFRPEGLYEEEAATLRGVLAELDEYPLGSIAGQVHIYTDVDPDVPASLFALVPVALPSGETGLRLSLISAIWSETAADRFQAALSLSDSEMAVVETVVRGKTLQALADSRGRSLGTVRNQLKATFRKANVGSQTQLIALYAGFAQLTHYVRPTHDPESPVKGGPDDVLFVDRPDGTRIQVDFAGPENGRPVLMFNGHAVGHAVTPDMARGLVRHNIRLVMPWRAGWGGTEPDQSGALGPESSSRDVTLVLDHLGLESAPVLAEATGGIHALQAALDGEAQDRSRIDSILWVAPTFPIRTVGDLRHFHKTSRALFYLARYTPRLIESFMRFFIAKADMGHDADALLNVLNAGSDDEVVLNAPGVMDALRTNLARMRVQAFDGPIEDLKLQFSRWTQLDRDPPVPVHIIYGSDYFATGTAWPDQVARGSNRITTECVPNAGSLFYLTRFDRVLDRIAA